MIGYHYTTFANWQKIRKEGLVPYCLPAHVHSSLRIQYATHKETTEGIWVWQRKPVGRNHLGNMIRVLAKHNSTQIVLLQVEYGDEDIYKPNHAQRFLLKHYGDIDKFVYHTSARADILIAKIPPRQIKMIQSVDLVQLVKMRS